MTNPLSTMYVTSSYAQHIADGGIRAKNPGTDLRAKLNPCYSVEAGTCTRGIDEYGTKWVALHSNDGRRVWIYVHLNSFKIVNGQSVTEGQQLGVTGNSGNAGGTENVPYHLHLGLKINGAWSDPMAYLNSHIDDDMTIDERSLRYLRIQRPKDGFDKMTPTQCAQWWVDHGMSELKTHLTEWGRLDVVDYIGNDPVKAKSWYCDDGVAERNYWYDEPSDQSEANSKLDAIDKIIHS